jgi:DNA repair exonuclease SbcCD ATPase subunit
MKLKIVLTKDVVNTYAPYVRISTSKSNPKNGAVRVSNSGARWGLSGSDFAQLFKASIFMLAYSVETVEEIRQEYDLRKDVEFEVQGISPIELIQLSEAAVNRDVPKGGRPKPKFANLEGELMVHGTQPRKVGELSPAGKPIKSNEGTLVGVSSNEPKSKTVTKKEKLVVSENVEKKEEVSDESSVRFHNSGETVLPNDLEKELETLKSDYKNLEGSYNTLVGSYNNLVTDKENLNKELKGLKKDLKAKDKDLTKAEERIAALETENKGLELRKTELLSEKADLEEANKKQAEYIQTLEEEHKAKLSKVQETVLAKEREVIDLKNAQDGLSKQLQEVRATLNSLKAEKSKKTLFGALSDLKEVVVAGLKNLFGQK